MTGEPIPELPDSVPGELLTWRFPEPPHPLYPDRPFILVAGQAIDSPEPWMHEHASALIDSHHRFIEAHRAAYYDGNTEPLEGLVSQTLLNRTTSMIARFRERGQRFEQPPSDYGVVAIEFQGKPDPFTSARARAYTWVHSHSPRLWSVQTNEYVGDPAYSRALTSHRLPSWRLMSDGTWQISNIGHRPPEFRYDSESFVAETAPALLPYYLLNAEARQQVGLPSEDELDPDADEEQ